MGCIKCSRKSSSGRYKKGLCHSCYNTQWGKTSQTAKAIARAGYLRNKALRIERAKQWRLDHPEEYKKHCAQYKQRHLPEHAARQRKRYALQVSRIPKWANLKKIEQFYKNRPDGMTVDHIYPLKGRLVSGLHVLENLQYLTHSENAKKGNRLLGVEV